MATQTCLTCASCKTRLALGSFQEHDGEVCANECEAVRGITKLTWGYTSPTVVIATGVCSRRRTSDRPTCRRRTARSPKTPRTRWPRRCWPRRPSSKCHLNLQKQKQCRYLYLRRMQTRPFAAQRRPQAAPRVRAGALGARASSVRAAKRPCTRRNRSVFFVVVIECIE